MNWKRLIKTASLLAAALLTISGLIMARSVYRRIETRLLLAKGSFQTEGILTEKTTGSGKDLIFPFTTCTARYTFPNAEGVIRNGEQELTAREFAHLPDPGRPVTVFFNPAEDGRSALSRSPGFPGAAGWRSLATILLLLGAAFLTGFGFRQK